MKNNALLYLRVSHDEQVKFGLSLETQKELLLKYCDDNNLNVKGIYADKGISGSTIKKRKEFQRMIEESSSGDVILFTKLDRFSRNLLDANIVVQELEKKNVSIKAINEDDIDTTTADGKFIFNLKLSLAQREREKTSERIKDVFDYKKSVGEVITGATPIGYRIENKKYVIDQERSEEIKFIFNTFDETNSKRQTLYRYHEKYNNKKCIKTISRVLQDTIYIGERYGNKNFCEPIIDKKVFYRVQERLKNNIREVKKSDRVYIFTGLIKCPICGAKMNSNHIQGYKYYRCPNNKLHYRCSFGLSVREDKLEQEMIDRIKLFKSNDAVEFTNNHEVIDYGQKQLDIKKKIERTKELYIDGDIDKDTYKAKISHFETLLQEYEEILATNKNEPKSQEMALKTLDMYNKLTDENKRSFWHRFVEQIEITEDKKLKDIIFID